MRFEWDSSKDASNLRKHGIGFDDAKQLFESGSEYLELFDEDSSRDEERFIAIGPIRSGIIAVVWTERSDDIVRIISARYAIRTEIERFQRYMEDER